jgi:hypothetical protein
MDIIQLYNPGVTIDKVPTDIFNNLKEKVLQKRELSDTFNNYRKSALQILSIKEIDDTPYFPEMEEYLNQSFLRWRDIFNVSCEKFIMDPVWTNYMRATEYAPMHNHSPAIASFVIWVQVPYEFKNEKQVHYEGNIESINNKNGTFEFMYSSYTGAIEVSRILLDSSYEGTIIFFPGNMMHCVYPFFSTSKQRISVSGNFYCLEAFRNNKI